MFRRFMTLFAITIPVIAGLLLFLGDEGASIEKTAEAGGTRSKASQSNTNATRHPRNNSNQAFEVVKSKLEWRKQLSYPSYHVTREKGTEKAFSGKYWNSHQDGIYTCICCDHPLFDSNTKFKSGTGWPSFWMPLKGAIRTRPDVTFFSRRTEVICDRCGAHLGHVFNDGPPPTGLRFCMNSVALKLVPKPDKTHTDKTHTDKETTDKETTDKEVTGK